MRLKDNIGMDDLFYVKSNYRSVTDNKVQRQYASCSLCGEFANIHCVTCTANRTWLCQDHWRDHRLKHTAVFQ
jgi:CO dehydrogenase/acetyl-CoA synthase beta subunit